MAGGRVEVIESKGCSRFFVEPLSPAASSAPSEPIVGSTGPFSGLVICVTGLSKEARKQVMFATERMGGRYSPNLHPLCTHLVVQSFGGRKFEHACKHGLKNGLFIVSLSWLVDSVKRNTRLSESLYCVKSIGDNGLPSGELHRLAEFTGTKNTRLPTVLHEDRKPSYEAQKLHLVASGKESTFASLCLYIDSTISCALQEKVIEAATREGASFADHWFIGCDATHVVCEAPSILKYIGHAKNLVTPMWIIKTAKEKYLQRLVHMSADLAKQVGMMLENVQNEVFELNGHGQNIRHNTCHFKESSQLLKAEQIIKEKQHIADLAKLGVRSRRGHHMQSSQTPLNPIIPSSLLDSICWSISEPTSTACVYTESSDNGMSTSESCDAPVDVRESEATFDNFSRPLRQSEKMEVIFKNHFLTILFPVDRFGEMGPSARTFFSDAGFTRLQLLDHIYAFYQEFMSVAEVELAIHTDSRHADRLRAVYASRETAESGSVQFKRIDFIGRRRNFEMLKRVRVDNNNVYELLIRA